MEFASVFKIVLYGVLSLALIAMFFISIPFAMQEIADDIERWMDKREERKNNIQD